MIIEGQRVVLKKDIAGGFMKAGIEGYIGHDRRGRLAVVFDNGHTWTYPFGSREFPSDELEMI